MDRRTFSLQSQHVLFYSFLLFLSPTSNGVSQSTSSNVAHPACALKESICLPISPRFTPTSLLLRGRFSTPPPRPMPELFRIFFPSHPDFRHFFTKNSWFSVSSSPATPNLDVFPVSITQFSPKISCFPYVLIKRPQNSDVFFTGNQWFSLSIYPATPNLDVLFPKN